MCFRQWAIWQLGVAWVSVTTWVCPYWVVAATETDADVVLIGTTSVAVTVALAWTSV
jgi:hypothetical protein